jgi:ribose 5-phosphate isomerase B
MCNMNKIIVALAADHAGFALKEELRAELAQSGVEYIDLGTNNPDSVDYPDFGRAVAEAIVDGRANRGVIVCGTGIGISIAANRVGGVRAAVCHDATTARLAREHNDANVLALGARIVGGAVAKDCLHAFLSTPFDNGERHQRRVEKLG